ncbi:MAG: hypothetical protein IAE99_04845 [Rhodothermales bacterium]|nr:hypothetical protein [Rhodothermales bacterium]
MPDRPDFREDGRDAGLSDALAERLRRVPPPDAPDGYFDTLADRTRARLDAAAPPRRAADRAPASRPPRRAGWRVAVPALALAVLLGVGFWMRADAPRLAQQRPPADTSAVPRAAPVERRLPDVRLDAAPTPERRVTPKPMPTPKPRRAVPVRPQAAPSLMPRRSQRLAAAPVDSMRAALPAASLRLAAAPVDAEGLRLAQRAQLVVLALQTADATDDLALLAPLAQPLVDDLARWRMHDANDPALAQTLNSLEPVLIGLATLAPSDTLSARQLRDAARRADLSLQLDRALLAAGDAPVVAY